MKVHLYQIQYDEKTKPSEDSGFIAFDVRDKPEFLKREMAHMIRFYDEIVSLGGDENFYGLFSPKFNEKTGLGADDVMSFVEKNVEADVCLFNPYPMHVYRYLNVWQQGEENHPNLIRLASQMFKAAGFEFDPASLHRNSVESTVYCNYWVAKKSFFDVFIPFVRSMDKAIDEMPIPVRSEYFSDANYISKACYYPFLFERLLSAFLIDIGRNNASAPYVYENKISDVCFSRVEKSFFENGGAKTFDKWEIIQASSLEEISKKINVLQNRFYPKISFFKIKFLSRMLRSLLKTIYVINMPSFIRKNL